MPAAMGAPAACMACADAVLMPCTHAFHPRARPCQLQVYGGTLIAAGGHKGASAANAVQVGRAGQPSGECMLPLSRPGFPAQLRVCDACNHARHGATARPSAHPTLYTRVLWRPLLLPLCRPAAVPAAAPPLLTCAPTRARSAGRPRRCRRVWALLHLLPRPGATSCLSPACRCLHRQAAACCVHCCLAPIGLAECARGDIRLPPYLPACMPLDGRCSASIRACAGCCAWSSLQFPKSVTCATSAG